MRSLENGTQQPKAASQGSARALAHSSARWWVFADPVQTRSLPLTFHSLEFVISSHLRDEETHLKRLCVYSSVYCLKSFLWQPKENTMPPFFLRSPGHLLTPACTQASCPYRDGVRHSLLAVRWERAAGTTGRTPAVTAALLQTFLHGRGKPAAALRRLCTCAADLSEDHAGLQGLSVVTVQSGR